jgi:saccharopine dehydrogenase (NAD+, L-lysine-forming)
LGGIIASKFGTFRHNLATKFEQMKIGVIREGKVPPDQRVPMTPQQIADWNAQHPEAQIVVQTSAVRRIQDAEYTAAGVEIRQEVDDCDVLLGVKEVPVDQLIADKTYFFFSHTYKLQPYNARLLKAVMNKRIRLIDYELLRSPGAGRIIGFGRYAGIVGCYNGFRALGMKDRSYALPRAIDCEDRAEMEAHLLANVALAPNTKVILTGHGRVGCGALEILSRMKIREVHPVDFLREEYAEPVFTHLQLGDYNRRMNDGGFDPKEFRSDPTGYESTFMAFARKADLFIAGHYWSEGSPFLFSRGDMRDEDWRIRVVADISCDIDGPVACTLAPTTIADPVYGYCPQDECIVDIHYPGAITVMAVDNLPCELPRDASADFGAVLMDKVLQHLIDGDPQGVLAYASETDERGELTPKFSYLADYAASA